MFLIPCDFFGADDVCLGRILALALYLNALFPFDYDVDPRETFLKDDKSFNRCYGEELTLRVDDEAITFKVGQTLRYYRSYEIVNQVNVIDVACEEYAQEVLRFLDSSLIGNPTPSDPILASSSPSFTPFEGEDFILEEIETFIHTPDELSNFDDDYYDSEGDILYLEKFKMKTLLRLSLR
ncbi:hypothetical protein Tco_1556561 [Tanacetum coccineum]